MLSRKKTGSQWQLCRKSVNSRGEDAAVSYTRSDLSYGIYTWRTGANVVNCWSCICYSQNGGDFCMGMA